LEIWTAVAAGLTGAIVTVESLSHDIGWNETGPGSGYFPFRVGLLLVGVAIVRVLQVVTAEARLKPGPTTDTEARLKPGPTTETEARLKPGPTTTAFVTREELGRSLSVFWPTAALVVAMYPLGCYVPSLVYLAWMMRRHGGYHWGKSVAFATAVTVAFFLIFELWFSVPLAKGPLEAALGLY
jgi:hypothetical protein